MQNFYKVTQGNHEKVPSYAMRLEGTLNQIRLKCPRWIADHEVTWHLKDQLFHGVCKNIRDSIRYLHSNPETNYSQLMLAAHKAENKMEEAKEKVRARSATATEVVDGSKELGNQIMRLMATLTRAEQGNWPASAPKSPRHSGSYPPQLPQWSDWPGSDHLCLQLLCCKSNKHFLREGEHPNVKWYSK